MRPSIPIRQPAVRAPLTAADQPTGHRRRLFSLHSLLTHAWSVAPRRPLPLVSVVVLDRLHVAFFSLRPRIAGAADMNLLQ